LVNQRAYCPTQLCLQLRFSRGALQRRMCRHLKARPCNERIDDS
jgi:hypothetical protein